MYDDTITFDRLEPNEQAVITAIRRWRDFRECAPCKILTREAREQIAVFISFLWRSDPFAVNIGVIFQQELRLFEVQLLYAISEQLAGKSTTVAEVVAWWFPASKQVQARESLQTIGDAMRVAGVSVVSADWVRGYFQAMTFSRVRRKAEPAAQKNLENDYAEPVSAMVH